MRLNMANSNNSQPYPPEGHPDASHYLERDLRMATYARGFFASVGATLDCLAASLIGACGLSVQIKSEGFGAFRPTAKKDEGFPTQTDKAVYSTLMPRKSQGRDRQLVTLRGWAAALREAGPEGWFDWAIAMRNMAMHREQRMELINMRRKKGSRAWVTDRLVAADPDASNMQALRGAGHWFEDYYLHEDAKVTLDGVAASMNAAVTAIVALLEATWDARQATPELIVQPARQWSHSKRPVSFSGYAPGTAEVGTGQTMKLNPLDVHRMRSGGLLS